MLGKKMEEKTDVDMDVDVDIDVDKDMDTTHRIKARITEVRY